MKNIKISDLSFIRPDETKEIILFKKKIDDFERRLWESTGIPEKERGNIRPTYDECQFARETFFQNKERQKMLMNLANLMVLKMPFMVAASVEKLNEEI